MNKHFLEITGHSDDIILFSGTIEEEFYPADGEDTFISFEPGGMVKVHYDQDGIWRISLIEPLAHALLLSSSPAEEDLHDSIKIMWDVRSVKVRSGTKEQVIGEAILSEKGKSLFSRLEEIFSEGDSFDDVQDQVKSAILTLKVE